MISKDDDIVRKKKRLLEKQDTIRVETGDL